jgi:hypothetical protein
MLFRLSRRLQRVGGWSLVSECLAEDYAIGRAFSQAGLQVIHAPEGAVHLSTGTGPLVSRFVNRPLRWSQMRRASVWAAYLWRAAVQHRLALFLPGPPLARAAGPPTLPGWFLTGLWRWASPESSGLDRLLWTGGCAVRRIAPGAGHVSCRVAQGPAGCWAWGRWGWFAGPSTGGGTSCWSAPATRLIRPTGVSGLLGRRRPPGRGRRSLWIKKGGRLIMQLTLAHVSDPHLGRIRGHSTGAVRALCHALVARGVDGGGRDR